MALTLYWHPQCQTCRKVKKWLDDHQVSYNEMHIVKSPPSREELQDLYQNSGLEIKNFVSTSTKKYRELGLKDKIKTATEKELLDLLATDGMLLKKPILTNGEKVIIGFKEEELEKISSQSLDFI
ncbi:arsenate reductase family protein [Neobacillus sp. PS3-40]|uniref:arsenate reductase family protein n=1 Tax=Neobacillus sp. PS3-40 TaxID=3070679 RepID=UPI0027E0F229|nr:arsenate reductase family protein [Neobacillus sp. PS3-40]WML43908.1 arsenate reductase family protein [Neobacillus sp. PS3-40]